jgi:hypothetical protein
MTRAWVRYADRVLLWIASAYWLEASAWLAHTVVIPPPRLIMADHEADPVAAVPLSRSERRQWAGLVRRLQ